jgi:hypothetical protein
LRNNPEHALPSYSRCSIAKSQRNWADGPAKKEQEKMLKSHWVVLGRLRNVGITLAEVVGQYHARGVVPLRRRPLQICDMTADRAPWVGTVITPELSSPLEVQRRVAQAIGRATYSWPPLRMLPILPNAGKEKFVSCPSSRCDTPGFQLASLTLMTKSAGSNLPTFVKPRSTWVITSKTSPTNPNDPLDQVNTHLRSTLGQRHSQTPLKH